MESVIYSVATAVIVGAVGWAAGRFSVKTKTQEKADETSNRVDRMEDAIPLLLKCQLAILLALKRGHVNGECDDALDDLNKYLCERK